MENSGDEIFIEFESMADNAASGIDTLSASIDNLLTSLTSGLAGLREFSSTLSEMQSVLSSGFSFDGLEQITNSISELSKGNIEAINNNFSMLFNLLSDLHGDNLEAITRQSMILTSELDALNITSEGLAKGFQEFADNADRAGNAVQDAGAKTQKAKGFFDGFFGGLTIGIAKIFVLIKAMEKLGKTIGGLVKESTAFIGNWNMFNAIMGDSRDAAHEFVNTFSQALNLDPSSVMKYAATFQQLAQGFGVANDRAFIMSKNLTQLTYDMAAFTQIPIEQAMQKLQSAFTGQLKPIRDIGVALDQATLQEVAYSLGIEKKVSAMTKAQKTELVYYQIMKSTQHMQGTFAKTLWQPQTALMALEQSFKATARAVGNIFIPILQLVLPVVMAITRAIQYLANLLAGLLGFKLPDMSGAAASAGALADGMEDVATGAGNANKELDRMLQKFDDLNVIKFDTGAAGGAGMGDIGGGSLGIELPEYDALAGLTDQAEAIINKLNDMFKWLFSDVDFTALTDAFKQAGEAIIYTFEGVGKVLAGFGERFFKPILTYALNTFVPEFINIFSGLLLSIDWNKIANASNVLWDTLTRGVQKAGDFMLWWWDILADIGGWFMNNVVPAGIEVIAGAFSMLNFVIDTTMGIFQFLWTNALEPIYNFLKVTLAPVLEGIGQGFRELGEALEYVGGKVRDFLDWLNELLAPVRAIIDRFTEWVKENETVQTVLNNLGRVIGWILGILAALAAILGVVAIVSGVAAVAAGIFGAVLAFITSPITLIIIAIAAVVAAIIWLINNWEQLPEIIAGVWDKVMEFLRGVGDWIWENVIQPVIDFFVGLWTSIVEGVQWAVDSIVEWFIGVATWFYETLIKPVNDFFAGLWAGILEKAQNMWNSIKETFIKVATWFYETLIKPVNDFFSNLWSGILDKAKGMWTSIKDTFIGVATWFYETLIKPVNEFFSGMWDSVKEKAKRSMGAELKMFSQMLQHGSKMYLRTHGTKLKRCSLLVVQSSWE